MYKLAVFDLDGTLLNNDYQISKENMKAINLLKENNIKVVIATGRSNELIKPFLKVLNISDDVITCNGTVIGHPNKDIMLYEDILSKSEVRKTLKMCEKYGHQYLIYTSKAVVARQKDWDMFLEEKNVSNNEDFDVNFIMNDDIENIINNHRVNKILIIERNEEKYQELSKRVLQYDKVAHTQSFGSYLDIGPLNNSKGKAVEILCKKLGYKLEEVIAFGDQINDISMISIVGFGVAMANARDQVKKIADFVSLSNDDNGVAYAINTKILNKWDKKTKSKINISSSIEIELDI